MVFVDPVLQHRGENNNPPPSPTGCAPHDAVVSMLHHLESTYRWETEWDDRHEDTYWDGEMTSYRRIVLPQEPQLLPPSHQQGDAKEESSSSSSTGNTATSNIISFIFVEDQMHSYCFITSNKSTSSCTVTMKEKYDKIMAALEDGKDLLLAAAAADEEEEE